MLKYEELVNTLLNELAQGTYQIGDRLPTTPELCRIYGVSNTTVKRAMDELEIQGIVARRRGSGVYIKETSVQSARHSAGSSASGQMTGLTAEYSSKNVVISTHVVDFAVDQPSPFICEALHMEPDEFAYRICRVRIVDGTPKVVEYTHMPIKVIPGLRQANVEGSIYSYIEDDLGLKIGSAHRTIKAIMPTEDERVWLHLDESSPLLEVSQVAYLADGTPFEDSKSHHTNDYEFYSISTR